MQNRHFFFIPLLVGSLSAMFLGSCTGHKQKKYVAQIKENLAVYDSVTSILISKYSNYSFGGATIVYPSEEKNHGDGFRVFDASINDFCNRNDVNYIQVYLMLNDDGGSAANVTYFLSDNNYQYIYQSNGMNEKEVFENTRVRIVPINDKWIFQYEKPNL